MKQRALEMPAVISDNICTQVINLQNKILNGQDGIPTLEQTQITHKLVLCLMKMKNYPSSGSLIQFMQAYLDQAKGGDRDFLLDATHLANHMFKAKNLNGFTPLDFEYNTTPSYLQQQEPPLSATHHTSTQPADTNTGKEEEEKNIISATSVSPAVTIPPTTDSQQFTSDSNVSAPAQQQEKSGTELPQVDSNEQAIDTNTNNNNLKQPRSFWQPPSPPSDYLQPGTPQFEEREIKRRQTILQTLHEMKRGYKNNHTRRRRDW
jgi:hypothetical protein